MATQTSATDADKLSQEIFSILETQFLFTSPKNSPPRHPTSGKVRILSLDSGDDALLAAVTLSRLESSLRLLSGDKNATIADFFDVAAGSGAGGVLTAMLFTKPISCSQKRPLSAAEALQILSCQRTSLFPAKHRWWHRRRGGELGRIFGGATLRDTVKAVLVPCCDMATAAPFVFSRADAVEMDGCDFAIADVCAATCADRAAGIQSVDGRRKVKAVAGDVVGMGNPAAMAVTHVLNNKHEFPFANGIDDLLVLSIGSAGVEYDGRRSIAGAGAADMVDQAVAMAFGQNRTSNYVRIQANGFGGMNCRAKPTANARKKVKAVEDILSQRNVESVMFRGKRVSDETNGEKLERFAGELMKENERRRKSLIPSVVLKQVMTPRTSSATTSTVVTNATTTPSTRSSSSSSMSPVDC